MKYNLPIKIIVWIIISIILKKFKYFLRAMIDNIDDTEYEKTIIFLKIKYVFSFFS
jgi:hypothetical protein